MKKYFTAAACIAFVLSGCTAVKTQEYSANSPKFDIRNYFNGKMKAEGVFFSLSGKADPQFTIAMQGQWDGNDGTLQEHFIYNDGHTQERMWTIHVSDDHHLTATAADVEGIATGEQYGNALHMRYVLDIPEKGDPNHSHAITMDDWIFQLDDKTGINRVQMSKFGFNVGELVITFRKM